MKQRVILILMGVLICCNTVEAKSDPEKKARRKANLEKFWNGCKQVGGAVLQTAVAVGTDYVVNKSAPEQAEQFRKSMQSLNENSKRIQEERDAQNESYKKQMLQDLKAEGCDCDIWTNPNYTYDPDKDYKDCRRRCEEALGLGSMDSPMPTYNTSLSGTMLEGIGISNRNIELGRKWANAENKYDKQNVAKEFVFDLIAASSNNPELIEKFRKMSDIQNQYLSGIVNANGDNEAKQVAISNKNIAYANLMSDSYFEAKERQAKHLSEKMNIQRQLLERGYNDPQLATEVAGSILAIQKSKDLTDEEKNELLKAYGFTDVQSVRQIAQEVINGNYSSNKSSDYEKVKEEAKHKLELETKRIAEQKAVEERKNAIQKIETTKIALYAFDEITLSQNQKAELDNIADILNKYFDMKIRIIGHTCEIGYNNVNQKKGLKRAEEGKKYLIDKGVASERIFIESKGKTDPIAPNTSSENRKKNRRIEFVVE